MCTNAAFILTMMGNWLVELLLPWVWLGILFFSLAIMLLMPMPLVILTMMDNRLVDLNSTVGSDIWNIYQCSGHLTITDLQSLITSLEELE